MHAEMSPTSEADEGSVVGHANEAIERSCRSA
jgi:hypothetical protein